MCLQLIFDNEYHNGQMTVELKLYETSLTCHGNVIREGNVALMTDDDLIVKSIC